ncbi:Endonuclease [Tenacibaculum litopenaei]|jgi:endonuclease/exonuclease/phosphatase family metal-dependent hydrolase|uniref:endonuclease/exonuclease/phosphatase family protein n=1 Tax=Tenacibaculum litopenaei TaxID=396016 RepID=UPI003895A6D4
MKKFSILNSLLFFINSVLATALLLSYFLPYISPVGIPYLTIVSLFVPLLVLLNLGFVIYWLIKLHKNTLLSGVVLLLGWFMAPPLIKFSNQELILTDDLKVMSFNVRMFNYYGWNKDSTIEQQIYDFVNNQSPDVLALQEYYQSNTNNIRLPFKYVKTKSKSDKFGLAIYSKFPIINSGSLDFKDSANNCIYIDIVKQKDTIRIYNVHLESLKINPKKENFGEQNSERLLKRLANGFKKQGNQTLQVLSHKNSWTGKEVLCGDFNNTAYSWVYKQLSKDRKDAFIERGIGMGKTFRYLYPMRIDFILSDKSSTVNHFKTFNQVKLSDHYPIMSRMNW